MAPRRARRPRSEKQLKIRPRQDPSSSPSVKQLYAARILTWIIVIVLGTGIVLLFTNNPWGAAILTALGLVGQPIFDRFLKHFERWVRKHFTIVKAILPVV